MDDTRLIGQLYRLARLYNVQTAFYGVRHRRHTAPAESLLAVLRALGAPVASLNDIASARREREQAVWRQVLEPVTVAWDGERPVIPVILPADIADTPGYGRLEMESGEGREWKIGPGGSPVVRSAEVEGQHYTVRKLIIPERLPHGYHKLFLEVKGKRWETMIIAAPRKTYSPVNEKDKRSWGAFLPLYALKTAQGWGSGDYSGLGALMEWVVGEGGNSVGTLPLLPVFLDGTYDPSPYAPVSRLLWNEYYVDITKAPELIQCPPAQALVQSADLTSEIESLRGQTLVDYRRVMNLKRRAMEEIVRHRNDWGTEHLEEFRRFARENHVAEEYARFRAVMEKQHVPWQSWPARLCDGDIRETDYDEDIKNYHLYAQWLARRQVRELAEKANRQGVKLYFDLPVGVHPDGYDVWRHRDIFATGVSAGAPPDPVFTTGQDWGFPPLHPEKVRAQGYHYIRDYISHHLRYAAMLRIDHVMGLHRLYWVPRGFAANQGVYVRHRAEELYAILAVESHRHRSVIIGEDLGIVPGYIRPAMARHGLHRLYILYYELADSAARTPRRIPRHCVAGLNTHDMPPFAAFWEGADIRENTRLGILKEKDIDGEIESRRATKTALTAFLRSRGFFKESDYNTVSALKACLSFLSASRAHTVMVNLEDLWLETRPQNVPGTGDRYPSWQRKARYALEEFCRMSEVSDILGEVRKMK
jgi:4-alpha-glucanotransferase